MVCVKITNQPRYQQESQALLILDICRSNDLLRIYQGSTAAGDCHDGHWTTIKTPYRLVGRYSTAR